MNQVHPTTTRILSWESSILASPDFRQKTACIDDENCMGRVACHGPRPSAQGYNKGTVLGLLVLSS
jgi:hypothetical protein